MNEILWISLAIAINALGLIFNVWQWKKRNRAPIERYIDALNDDKEYLVEQIDEKDADIKMLTEQNLALGEVVLKKDAEIERLIKERDEARRDVGVAEQNHYESAKEVDRLRYICSCYALQYGTVMGQRETIKEIRDEAITEFEKRLKEHECLPEYPWDEPFVLAGCIDQIAKEMKGDQRE